MVWSVETGADMPAVQQTSMLRSVVPTTLPMQQTTMLSWGNLSERAQKIKGLNFCASQFVTEDEVKYCVAKLFSGDVKFATMADY
mmetsp:Transcript_26517/g.69732  ORF Transcript_26517/g.69732 Transcript_26517/m.69732 type:complete len:85 (-) Transcript_26517:604-858(-)|eukprot:CAMPEP_0113678356 /NCGR_PEP_ID=MMETSP0038_2-20120614/9893_1 /TAXON_ID=2898 /ORGANISM="Cryptomonas paramecium" /LENGTH=84 /DNA_ID=CAMNT_0000595967 /DNA_START=22 /DNA_END=276 /DNA_ORIENTATION=+ /assembly_acc=CAM_ASM_000170